MHLVSPGCIVKRRLLVAVNVVLARGIILYKDAADVQVAMSSCNVDGMHFVAIPHAGIRLGLQEGLHCLKTEEVSVARCIGALPLLSRASIKLLPFISL